MNCFSKFKSFIIFVFIFCDISVKSEDNFELSYYSKRGKTHVRPTRPTQPPELEIEPEVEVEPEYEPEIDLEPITEPSYPTDFTIPEWEPGYSHPEGPWHPIVITQKPPKPEPGWHPITITTHKPQPERTTKRTPRPEPEWTFPTTRRTTARPEPEWEPTTKRTTPRPEPERTTRRTTPRPEPERTTISTAPEPERTTTRKPKPEVEPPPSPPQRPITTTKRPHPEPEHPPAPESPGCQVLRCRKGYRCDCINQCPATCREPNRKPCPAHECKIGCVCDNGYVLDENNGHCVPLRECQRPPISEEIVCNELCTNGKQCSCQNPCPATCANPDPTPCPTLQCNPGCYTVCRKGFVLDRIGGDCIPLQYCPNHQCISKSCIQHENEVYYECSTRLCNRTCDEPNRWCSGQCIKPGNFDCKPGYVRDLRSGRCVPPLQCSQPIRCDKKDEVFYDCDTRMCQRTCQRPNPTCAAVCRQPGNCDCRPGLVRDVKTCRCVDKNDKSCLAQRISEN